MIYAFLHRSYDDSPSSPTVEISTNNFLDCHIFLTDSTKALLYN